MADVLPGIGPIAQQPLACGRVVVALQVIRAIARLDFDKCQGDLLRSTLLVSGCRLKSHRGINQGNRFQDQGR